MNEKQMEIQAQLDQFGALMRDIAPHVAAYYRGLVEHGLPEPYAQELTAEFQQLWLVRLFGLPQGQGE